jgi:nitroreductase
MTTISNEQLDRALRWRYATKVFDPARKIPADTWATLEQALILSPSSFGLQPYQFLIVQNPELRAKLLPFTWGQKQVVDCSHYVVFTARTRLTAEHLDAFIRRIAEVRGVSPETEALKNYRGMMAGSLLDGGPVAGMIPEWAARQAYIAIGNLMTSAALLGVDTCPIEGFQPDKYDEVLNLKGSGFASVVCCALGYRAASDKYATLPKVRLPQDQLIRHL